MEGYNDIIQQQPSIKNAVSTQGTQWDPTNALALSQTDDLIELFVLKACGLYKVKIGQEYKLRRFNKPMVTYEFANDHYGSCFIRNNHITGRSKTTEENIRLNNLKTYDIMVDIFAGAGINNVISDEIWIKALDLLNYSDEELKKPAMTRKNLWYTEHNIEWDFHEPFTLRMINIIKKIYKISVDAFGAAPILRRLGHDTMNFNDLAQHRSVDGLTLEHEKVIHKETLVNTSDKDNKSSEGRLEGVKRFIRGALS